MGTKSPGRSVACLEVLAEGRLPGSPHAVVRSRHLPSEDARSEVLSTMPQAPVASMPSVDLVRYGGNWFEIASFPVFFQRNCILDTTAEYALAAGGGISVHNRCRTKSGFDEARGKTTVVEGS